MLALLHLNRAHLKVLYHFHSFPHGLTSITSLQFRFEDDIEWEDEQDDIIQDVEA